MHPRYLMVVAVASAAVQALVPTSHHWTYSVGTHFLTALVGSAIQAVSTFLRNKF
jgi:hypothetical protein